MHTSTGAQKEVAVFTNGTRGPVRRRRTSSRFLFAVRGALGLTAALALSAPSASLPAAASAHVTRSPATCGTYQCFLDATAFLQSTPDPLPGQVATVPLAARTVGPARGAPSMLIGLDNGARAFWAVSDGFAQGRSGKVDGVSTGNVYNFDHWQYADELYYYLHTTVSVPPTQWVNAGHRNGVPVLGTVTGDCPPDDCDTQAAKLFNAANYRKTVQKMYDYAVAYGFDGWVIDMENNFQPSDTVLAAVKELSAMVLPDHKPMRVAVYHAFEYTIKPAPDGMLPYFKAGADWQADYIDAPGYPKQTYQTLQGEGLASQRFRAYWSSYVYKPYQANCTQGERTTTSQIWNGNPGQCLNSQRLFDNQRTIVPSPPATQPRYYTSTGLFAPEWTYFGNLPDPPPGQVAVGPVSRTAVHAADDALWVGADVRYSGRSCTRSGTGNAVSSLITPRSVVGRLPFVTNFNEGEGSVYAINGKLVKTRSWNNLSAQDVLPTWYCSQRGDLTAAPAYATRGDGDAFNGGSALALSGRGAGQVALYDARIRVAARSLPTLAFTSKTVTGALPYARVTFSDGTSQTVPRTAPGRGWRQTTRLLRAARGKTIVQISVGFAGGNRPVRTVLGQLRLYDASRDTRPSPIYVTSTRRTISWKPARKPAVSYWNVYLRARGCLRFLGPAFTTTYSVAQSMFAPGTYARNYVIQPVSASGSAAVLRSAHRPCS
jgi:endo-beta-N-acetylglucosaminidase D